jgi:UDP-N-acetylglucosamine acyltransferase
MTEDAQIHSTALISPLAELAADVRVGPYSVIDSEVTIEQGTVIGSHVVVHGPTHVGKDNRIYDFSAIGGDPQDKKYAGEHTRLEIGDGNTIREYCTLNRGTLQDGGVTRIGNDNWLMAGVHVAHDCQLGDHIIMANNATLAGHVRMHDYVICSGFAGLHQYCQIGAHSFLGAGVKINRDVPPYIMVVGDPGSPRGINSEGLKRRGFSAEQIRNLKEAYRILYRSGLRLTEAHEQLKELSQAQPELRILVEFLDRSERSILR